MNALQSAPAELRLRVTITRKATGKVETFEMIGHMPPAAEQPADEEARRVSHAPASGS